MRFGALSWLAASAVLLGAAPSPGLAQPMMMTAPVMTEQNPDAMQAAWKAYEASKDRPAPETPLERRVAAEVMQAREGLLAAVRARDAARIGTYFADDFLLLLGTATLSNKADRVAALARGPGPFETLDFLTSKVQAMDADNAVLTALIPYTAGGTAAEKLRYGLLRGVFVMHRAKEGWRMVAAQSLRLPVEPPAR
jgi:hypothetical protein